MILNDVQCYRTAHETRPRIERETNRLIRAALAFNVETEIQADNTRLIKEVARIDLRV
jgi:hypothetical protein